MEFKSLREFAGTPPVDMEESFDYQEGSGN